MNITRQYKLYRLGVKIEPKLRDTFLYMEGLFGGIEKETHIDNVNNIKSLIYTHYKNKNTSYIYKEVGIHNGSYMYAVKICVNDNMFTDVLNIFHKDVERLYDVDYSKFEQMFGELVAMFLNTTFGENHNHENLDVFCGGGDYIKEKVLNWKRKQ